MTVRLPLAFAVVLAVASPAIAQTAPAPSAPVPPASASAEAAPSPEMTAAIGRMQAAGEALDGVMEDLGPRAEAVRADAALSPEEKEARIRAMIAEHQPAFDAFTVALGDMVRQRTLADGKSAAEADTAAGMMGPMVMSAITAALITGEDPDQDDGEDHGEHEGH